MERVHRRARETSYSPSLHVNLLDDPLSFHLRIVLLFVHFVFPSGVRAPREFGEFFSSPTTLGPAARPRQRSEDLGRCVSVKKGLHRAFELALFSSLQERPSFFVYTCARLTPVIRFSTCTQRTFSLHLLSSFVWVLFSNTRKFTVKCSCVRYVWHAGCRQLPTFLPLPPPESLSSPVADGQRSREEQGRRSCRRVPLSAPPSSSSSYTSWAGAPYGELQYMLLYVGLLS